MKRLFLSDLHLGNPLFKYQSKLFDLLIEPYIDEIVICGDVFDIWEKNIEQIVKDYFILISHINVLALRIPVYIIPGNHDPIISELSYIFHNCIVTNTYEYDNNIVLHGSEFDNLILKYSKLSRILGYFNWIFERFNLDLKTFFRELFYSISAKRQKKYYNDLVSEIEKSVVEKYSTHYSTIIMGHTHMPKIVQSDCLYVNCGDMIHNYTYIIETDKKFKLYSLI